jgi:hypothetical protein
MVNIPYALAHFDTLRRDQCFYIDRTHFIELLEVHGTRYAMFLRPRRFGKSLWISILEHYYDVNKVDDFQLLFGDLNIGRNKTVLANQFMILRFDFSGIETNDVSKVHDAFLMKVKSGFQQLISHNVGSQILADLRHWYDGYRFNLEVSEHLYNPEMVLYFATYYQSEKVYPNKMLTANFATDYKKIANIFRIGNQEGLALTQLNQFLEKGEINSYLTERFNTELGFTISDIWSMLFYSGMTTIKAVFGNDYTFQMPNYVIKGLYYDYFMALGNCRERLSTTL